MPHIDSYYPSKYLKSADLGGKVARAIIDRLEVEDVGDGERKPILFFVGKERGLVLNRVNADTLGTAFGPETDEWGGKEIEIFVDPNVYMSGKRVGGLRVRVPQKTRLVNNPQPQSQRTVPRQPEPAPESQDGWDGRPSDDPLDGDSVPF